MTSLQDRLAQIAAGLGSAIAAGAQEALLSGTRTAATEALRPIVEHMAAEMVRAERKVFGQLPEAEQDRWRRRAAVALGAGMQFLQGSVKGKK